MMRFFLTFLPLLLGLATATLADEVVVTREDCAACHEEGDLFAIGPHGRAMAARDVAILDRSCVTCHQAGNAHIEDPVIENVVRNPGSEVCVSCHPESSGQLHLVNPAHSRQGVACLDCHDSGHREEGPEPLLVAAPFELCGGCHRPQAVAANQPFAHREGGEPFACTTCHSGHGETRSARLALADKGGACLDCHTETAGPFVFPHAPREVDGCLACHQPHGSSNPRMLTRRSVLNLCLECHSDVPSFHDLSRPRFRACLSCHPAVHGSNRDSNLFD